MAVAPAPVSSAAPSLAHLFPDLRPYTAEELAALSPDQVASLLTSVTKAGEDINRKAIQLQTQSEHLESQLAESLAQIETEFGVKTLEDLEALRQQELTALAEVYSQIHSQNPEA